MIQEDSYKIKFEKLEPWTAEIFQVAKKDLRNEHLLKTPSFAQKHFPRQALDKLTSEEFGAAYYKEITEGNEELGEKVVAHWVMKHAELYEFFAAELSKINPQFDQIVSLPADVSSFLLNTSVGKFGALATYLFCVMNAGVLPDEQLIKLREMALSEKSSAQLKEEKPVLDSLDQMKEHYERQMRKLTEKYEKRMQGLERKYIQDTEGLKRQISMLHKKMGDACASVR